MSRKLGDLLVEQGRITPLELQEALRAQRIFGGSLGTHLLQLGSVSEAELGNALEQVHGVPAVGRAELLTAAPEVFALLPTDYARRHRAMPFRVEGDELYLALQNPADTLALHEAAFLTGFRVVPHVAPEAVIRDALAAHLRLDPSATPAAPGAAHAAARPARDAATGPDGARHRPGGAARFRGLSERADDEESPTAELGHASVGSVATGRAGAAPGDPLAEAGRRLAAATTRDEVLAVALDEMAALFPRACAFAVRGREALLWRSTGLPRTPTRPIAIPLEESSVLSLPDDGPAMRYGPVASTPANQDLYILLGGRIPRVALVVPVQVKKRTVVVLYGDDPEGTSRPPDFVRVRRLAALTSWALEAVILRGKILRESGA